MGAPTRQAHLPPPTPHATLRRLLDCTRDVASFGGLAPSQARFLYAALLASIISADDKIRSSELTLFAQMVTQKLQLPEGALEVMADFITHGLNAEELAATSQTLRLNLAIEKRIELVSMLWELAVCDTELHPLEEEHIQRIAELIGVSGLRVIVEKMAATDPHHLLDAPTREGK